MSRIVPIVSASLVAFVILSSRAMGDQGDAMLPPTTSPSLVPPSFAIDVPQFSWDIFRVGPAEISLDDSSEIKLHYNISNRDTLIQAFEGDCRTTVPSSVLVLSSDTIVTSSTHANFTLVVDVVKENITSYSGVWTDDGVISVCLRVDLLLPSSGVSVHFHETKLLISVGLLQNFTITGVSVDREDPDEETGSVDLGFNITGFQCDQNGNPSDEVLQQGSDVYLCINTVSSDVEIADVRKLTMTQGEFSTTPIVDSFADPLTQVTISGKNATIRYQLVSDFFDDPEPQDVVANGMVLLAFTDNVGRRFLRSVSLGGRKLDENMSEEGFNVQMRLENSYILIYCYYYPEDCGFGAAPSSFGGVGLRVFAMLGSAVVLML